MEKVWSFKTANFEVRLSVEPDYGYRYDGDDEDGLTQQALDEGNLVVFDSLVEVLFQGHVIAQDSLGGSIYEAGRICQFWMDHWQMGPGSRNCEYYRRVNGQNAVVCHYFPSMIVETIKRARKVMRQFKNMKLRGA